jgi:hypothetical protein
MRRQWDGLMSSGGCTQPKKEKKHDWGFQVRTPVTSLFLLLMTTQCRQGFFFIADWPCFSPIQFNGTVWSGLCLFPSVLKDRVPIWGGHVFPLHHTNSTTLMPVYM